MQKLFTLISLILISGFATAQSFWTRTDEASLPAQSEKRLIIPERYQTVSFQKEDLRRHLEAAPWKSDAKAKQSPVTLTFPMPDGSSETFSIVRTEVMHPDLAAKFPEITTYEGQGKKDKTAILKLDITPQGVHGFILSAAQSTVFLDPYAQGDDVNHIVYYKRDFASTKQMICEIAEDNITGLGQNRATPGGDCQLRTYRLAISATGEYTAFHGGTVAQAQAAQVTTMNRVNGVLENDLAITMQIIANNDQIIYTNSGTDPFSNGNTGAMINENQTNTDAVIGSANYDLGHIFGTNSGGLAGLGVLCSGGSKARGVTGSGAPIGDPFDIDYVAHEMGHQLGANHTQNNNCNRNNATAMEPGSASTIQGYAGICAPNVQSNSDDYYHAVSIREMQAVIQSAGCGTITDDGNNNPVVNAGLDYTIPAGTFFELEATGSDSDGDALTYNWEQMDNATATMPPSSTSTSGPAFRSNPSLTSDTRVFPDITDIVANNTPTWEVISSSSRTYNFTVTVRDNNAGQGCTYDDDMVVTASNTGSAFTVTQPNTALSWTALSSQTVTWNVAGSNGAPINCSNVDIFLSTDGGYTYPITVATGVANTGSATITVPNNPTTTARIKVKGANNIFFDISNTNFTITAPTVPDFTVTATPSSDTACSPANGTFSVAIGSILGFSDPVTMSASGNPAGTSVSFSPNPVTPGSSTTMTISGTGSAADGTSTITITGTGSSGTHTDNVDFTILSSPSLATLASPADGATGVSIIPSYSWSAASGADSYEIQVATDGAFSNIVESATSATNSYTSGITLSTLTQYFWRVRSVNSCGTSAWSTVTFDFTTGTITCGTTVSSFPYNEDFESFGLCGINPGDACTLANGWTNETTDDIDWTTDEGGTFSSNTGPGEVTGSPTDYNPGTATGNYLYTEASTNGTGYPSMEAIATSPCFDLSSLATAELIFAYNMYGADMGTLNVDVSTDGSTWSNIWSLSGNQGDVWTQATVNLNAYAGTTIKIRFRGVTGANFTSDMAIDDVTIQSSACPLDPTASDSTICGSGSVTLSATPGTGGTTCRWYDAATGGTLLATGLSYTTPVLATTTTYYVASYDGACESGRVAVTVTVNSLPTVSFTGLPATICDTAATVTLSGSPVGGTFTGTGISGSSFDPATAGAGTYTITYSYTDGNGCTNTDNQSVTVNTCIPGLTNDDCSGAVTVTCGSTTSGTTTGASVDTPAAGSCGAGGQTAPGVWYYFAGTGDAVTVSTCNTAAYDTRLSVYSGTCGTLTCVAGNDDGTGCTGFTSELNFNSVNGTDYYILVHGYGTASGDFDLTLTCTPPCTPIPSNDDCASATTLTVGSSGSCSPTTGTNECASSALANPSCDPFGVIQDVWYTFNSGSETSVFVSLTDVTASNSQYAIYDACGGTEVFCSTISDTVTGLTTSTDYWIQVWNGGGAEAGTFDICVEGSSPCTPPTTPTITASGSTTFCAGDTVTLTSSSATGNQWNLNGSPIVGETSQNLLVTASGNYTVTVTNGCGSATSAITSVTVNPLPSVSFSGLAGPYCTSDDPVTLTGSPTGGTFSGTGISGGTFDPTVAGSGTYTINYSYTDGNGCSNSTSQSVTVNTLPTVSFSGLPATTCDTAAAITLTGSPSGGTFTGAGVSGNSFDPTTAGAGTYIITYSYTDGNGCSNTSNQSVTVNTCTPTVSNDDCSGAIAVSCGSTTAGTTTGASLDTPAAGSCGAGGQTAPGVWYYFAGTGDAVTVSTCNNATYDTRLSVYSGTCGSLSCVAGNDDGTGCTGFTSELNFNSVNGTDYYILVHGYGTASGDFDLTLTCTPPCTPIPSNDDCANATSLTVEPGGSCTATTGTNECASSALANPSCDPFGVIQDVWYTFNSGSETSVFVSLTDVTASNSQYAIYDACGGTEVFCSTISDTVTGLTTSTDYWIQVWNGGGAEAGTFDICIEGSSPCVPPTTPTITTSGSTTFCTGDSVNLTSSSTIGNQWNLNGSPIVGETSQTLVVTASGNYTVTVTNGCGSATSAITSVTVNPLPSVSFSGLNSPYCTNDGSVTLTGSPAGGTFSGTGISGNSFSPATAGAGTFTITYTYTNGNGCSASSTQSVTVNPLPTVSFSGLASSYCEGAADAVLSGSPAGGTFSGTGISGSTFSPVSAGTGTHTITYTYTNTNGCTNSSSQSVTINALPTVSFSGLPATVCDTAGATTLTGSPAGGAFSGTGISGNSFDPSVAGAGTYTITYDYTDGNGCFNSSSQSVTVNNCTPVVTNDDCSGAVAINCGASVNGTTTGATVDSITAGGCGAGGPTAPGVWYYFAGTGDAVTLSTCNNASYDTRISVYSGVCGSLTCVAGNDDGTGCSGFTSELTFNSVAGTDYYVLIHGYNVDSGDFTLSVSCAAPCTPIPSNDDCSSAATLTVEASGSCTGVTGTNECASAALSNPSCDAFGVIQDVWYTFNSGTDSTIIFNIVQGSASNIALAIYDSCGGNQLYCSAPGGADIADTLSGFATGTDYWVQVWNGGGSEAGTFTICLEGEGVCVPPATPTITANGATTFCEGENVTLTSSSAIGNQWFLNGSVISGATSSTLVADTSGTFTVTVTNGCGSATSAGTTVTVNPLPVVSFTGLNATYCDNDAATALTGSPAGGTFSGSGVTGSSFDPSAAGVGTHVITYDYTDGNGCSDSTTLSTTVNAAPVASISGLASGYCDTDADVTVSVSPAGGTLSGPGVTGTTFSPATAGAGTHTIAYTVTSSGCTDVDSVTVIVTSSGGAPTAGFTFTTSDLTATFTNTSTNASGWSWDFGDGATDSTENPVHTFTAPGTYTVCLTVNNACGGSDSLCSVITVDTTGGPGPGAITDNLDHLISIYPNPSNGVITVEMSVSGNVSAHITDVLGRKVMDDMQIVNPSAYSEKWDITQLSSGVYFVKVQVDDNVVMKRLVIEK